MPVKLLVAIANAGLWATLSATLPSPSVRHVAGFRGSPQHYFRANEFIELTVPVDGFERLARYIHDAYERAGALRRGPATSGPRRPRALPDCRSGTRSRWKV